MLVAEPLAPDTAGGSAASSSSAPAGPRGVQAHNGAPVTPSGSVSVAVSSVPTRGTAGDSDTDPASSALVIDTVSAWLSDSDPSETRTLTW